MRVQYSFMPENVNIQKIAELASEQIFSIFGWTQLPLMNQDWGCVEQENHHRQKKVKTHPTDAVFKYVDPYSGNDIYIQTDLKSYAKGTLESADLVKAIRELGHATECANKSEDWKRLYVDRTRNHDVLGMLFVYNHDGAYEKDFSSVLANMTPSSFGIAPTELVGVVSPQRVIYLNSIVTDIKTCHSDGKLPAQKDRSFFYPHLSRHMAIHQKHTSATLQTLLSPLIVIEYTIPQELHGNGYFAYYDGKGESVDEFKYLLDYFFKYQIATENTDVTINLLFPAQEVAAIFDLAKTEFARDYWPVANTSQNQFTTALDKISCRQPQLVVSHFSAITLGMMRR
jgi:hypothetical protein